MAKSEGREVREAFDGPAIEHDELIAFILERNADDTRAASVSGVSRQKIGDFIESTGMNSQALSWCRTILKKLPKDDGRNKAMDIIRSLKKALPMIEAHVAGANTPDMFDEDEEAADEDDIASQVTAAFGEGEAVDPFEADFAEEQAAFEADLAKGTVVPFTGAEVA